MATDPEEVIHEIKPSGEGIRPNSIRSVSSANSAQSAAGLERLIQSSFSSDRLDRLLDRPQITAIAFSGTIGIGLVISSGEFISLSGSLGCVLSFICAGTIVICVQRSLAEMVSVRPVSGALMDFPHNFVDEALGFAVGVGYCLAQCLSMATLTSAAARVANNFSPSKALAKSQTGGIIAGLLLLTLLSNVCGVRLYGNLERVVKWIKIFTIIALCVLMILVNLGVGGEHTSNRIGNYSEHGIVPYLNFAGFNTTDWPQDPKDTGVPGMTGRFLAVWTSTILATFPCMGGDIVIVAAGEARNPRKDLPAVTRFMYLVPLGCYILGSFLVGLNVNYSDPELARPWLVQHQAFEFNSPFIIALRNHQMAFSVLNPLFSALFLFFAYTAANTALFVSSRTLFAFVHLYGTPLLKRTLGRTNDGHTPLAAIVVCSLFGLLAFVGLKDDSLNQPVLTMSAFFTGSIACVYAAECVAYLRFFWGLEQLKKRNIFSRNDDAYKMRYYRARWQPFWAIIGLVGSISIVLTSGWPAIYILRARGSLVNGARLKPDNLLVADLVGAYAGPILFLALYAGYKVLHQTRLRTYEEIRDHYEYRDIGIGRGGIKRGWRHWIPEIWSFVK